MRVITGQAKGHKLKVPKRAATRPATSLVRGAIFSILEAMTDNWNVVLDLFSGSGSLGIEALSRGADWVDFVEQEPKCCGIIKENLGKTKLAGKAHVYCCSANKALSFLNKEYGIILMDPPYSDVSIGKMITKIANSTLVGTDSVLVVTHSPRLSLDPTYTTLNFVKEHRHGDSCIAIYRQGRIS